MRFGKTLRASAYEPWKDKYMDYGRLKALLRDDKADDDDDAPWTEEDENRFCDEVFNAQLEKVAQFQEETVERLRERVDAAFDALKDLAPAPGGDQPPAAAGSGITAQRLRKLEADLDAITNEVKELKKYSNLNYTGFLKIVKKHDRKRGDRYKIRPMMQLALSRRPFNSEQAYSPLLHKLSLMYYAIRQRLEENPPPDAIPADLDSSAETHNGERYTAHKFWVHPDNLLEVKTFILRRLPALVYSQSSDRERDGSEDPPLTSLYFDSPKFDLYMKKVDREADASSLRLRWCGQLSGKPEIVIEQKTVHGNGSSEERKLTVKEKYVKPFLDGEYRMEKAVQKMERQGRPGEEIRAFEETVETIQRFITDNGLQPVLRANYARTAFQKPADDRVRIAIDTDVAFIREDTLDKTRPCRDPQDWHRADIDNSNMAYPFRNINQSEVVKFPYAVLEIKLREDGHRKRPEWIEDLMASHLVHPAPRFSKFVHGVASLFEDYVNRLPFWLSEMESDIRKDPQAAFEEEEQRKAKRAADEQVVGSLLGAKLGSFQPSKSSPMGKSFLADRMASEANAAAAAQSRRRSSVLAPAEDAEASSAARGYGTISSVLPSFSMTRYSRARRAREAPPEAAVLPEGVKEPETWIKNAGPLKIEPKVWLANERTFLKWQHICVLLGALAVALYTAAGESTVAAAMGVAYICIAVFAGLWGYYMLQTRREMIVARSGKDFDNLLGPMVVGAALMAALVINFVLQYRAAVARMGAAEAAAAAAGPNATGVGRHVTGELL